MLGPSENMILIQNSLPLTINLLSSKYLLKKLLITSQLLMVQKKILHKYQLNQIFVRIEHKKSGCNH